MVALLQLANPLGKGVEVGKIRSKEKVGTPMDTMEITKIVGATCGALLVYLLTVTAADSLYMSGGDHGGHGDEHHGDEKASLNPASIYAVASDEESGPAEDGPSLEELLASADVEKGAKVFSKCKSCHKLETGQNGTGPHLFAVVDREIGAITEFAYSPAMAGLGGVWDAAALDAFLEKPKSYVPGTKMSFAGLKKPTDRANLIAYLETVQ